MKKLITLKSEFNRGDIVEYCNVKMKVLNHTFTTEVHYEIDKKGKRTPSFYTRVSLMCKVIEGETIPEHWNQDGTIYPLERDNDIKLIKAIKDEAA